VTANLITLENITLIKQDKEIIKEYSLHINQKQKINIYGDNGSGKTSLLKIIAGITQPTEGRIYYDPSFDMNKDIFYIGHKYGLKNELTVYQNLEYVLNFSRGNNLAAIESGLEEYSMKKYINTHVRYLSHGQKKIISFIQLALISNKLWLLDEPFTGLDKAKINLLLAKMDRHVSDMGSIIITSHNMKDNFDNIKLC
tara:strand:- start:2610 stop:3203 length:594 start_codon:yes stop_codon:yes gene_type:complete